MAEPHKIQCKQRTCQRSRPGFTGQAAGKAPHQRHEQHAKQGTRKAPSEAGHSKQRDAQHDEILAQRRVSRLINRHTVEHLVAGAAMVNLIKVHTVQLADGIRHGIRLVRERPAPDNWDHISLHIAQSQFKDLCVPYFSRQRLAGGEFNRGFRPAERRAVIEFFLKDRLSRRIADAQAPSCGNTGINPEFRTVRLRCEDDGL